MTEQTKFEEPTPAELRSLVPQNLGGVTWNFPEWRRQWEVIGFALNFTADAIEHRALGEEQDKSEEEGNG